VQDEVFLVYVAVLNHFLLCP